MAGFNSDDIDSDSSGNQSENDEINQIENLKMRLLMEEKINMMSEEHSDIDLKSQSERNPRPEEILNAGSKANP